MDTKILPTRAENTYLPASSPPLERHMIIVWSWSAGGMVESDSSWTVAGPRHGRDRVHCLDWPSREESVERLQHLITSLLDRPANVFVFLHRRHGYTNQQFQQLTTLNQPDRSGQIRCFLFGDGADPIYLSKGPRGLLGTSGTFTAMSGGSDVAPQFTSSVQDESKQIIKAIHFEYVWQIYQHAFRAAFFELREDFFRAFDALTHQPEIDSAELYNWLRQPGQRSIFLRLLSFIGRIRRKSSLEKELRALEAADNRQYVFSDLGVDLQTIYGESTARAYQTARQMLGSQVLAGGGKVQFAELRRTFDRLLEHLPEPTYP